MHSDNSHPLVNYGRPNLSETEGNLSVAAGSGLILYGLRRSLPLTLVGGALALRGLTRYCPVYEAAGIDRSHDTNERSVAVTIQRPAEDIYRFCSDMRNFPQFVSFLQDVHPEEGNRYRWTVEAAAGKRFSWTVELYEQTEPSAIRWRTLADAPLQVEGSLEFENAPANRGTRVRATAHFRPSGRQSWLKGIGKAFAKHKLRHDLGQLKQLMEAGEVLSVEGQPSGRVKDGSRIVDDSPGTQPIRRIPQPTETGAHP